MWGWGGFDPQFTSTDSSLSENLFYISIPVQNFKDFDMILPPILLSYTAILGLFVELLE